MFDGFDDALRQALSVPSSLYGSSRRSVATATARRASAENLTKAVAEANAGRTGFAIMHDTASRRYGEDAALMERGEHPFHHDIGFYLKTAEAYCRMDGPETEAQAMPAISAFRPMDRRAQSATAA